MAARLTNRIKENHRASIQVAMLLKRLTDHALDKVDMTATQIKATEILLKKAIPDLSSIDMTAEISGEIAHSHSIDAKSLSTSTLEELIAARASTATTD